MVFGVRLAATVAKSNADFMQFDTCSFYNCQNDTSVNPSGPGGIGFYCPSTSGQSPNLVHGLEVARELGLLTIAFTGKDGGRLASLAEHAFVVPSFSIHRIQETHVTLYHIVWDLVHVELGEPDVI